MKSRKRKIIEIIRCGWLNNDPVYITYHDEEWGIPQHNSIKLFEMLCLEGQQAGLSWITVLKKREQYRKVFFNFDPLKIVQLEQSDINKLLTDPGIIRHKGKIESIIKNAKAYLKMNESGEDFSNFIWSFVNHKQIVNNWKSLSETPTKTPISDALAKSLKQREFQFVGSTICYAFMQACGLVNDHVIDCYCRNK